MAPSSSSPTPSSPSHCPRPSFDPQSRSRRRTTFSRASPSSRSSRTPSAPRRRLSIPSSLSPARLSSSRLGLFLSLWCVLSSLFLVVGVLFSGSLDQPLGHRSLSSMNLSDREPWPQVHRGSHLVPVPPDARRARGLHRRLLDRLHQALQGEPLVSSRERKKHVLM